MKYIFFIVVMAFSLNVVSDDKVRPGPHNKTGLTKQSPGDKKETFLYKLFNDEINILGSEEPKKVYISEGYGQILSQIEKLADFKERGIITEAEFNEKKTILLDKIQ